SHADGFRNDRRLGQRVRGTLRLGLRGRGRLKGKRDGQEDHPEHAGQEKDGGALSQRAPLRALQAKTRIVEGHLGRVWIGAPERRRTRRGPRRGARSDGCFAHGGPYLRPAGVREMRTISWSCWPTRSSAESMRRSTT